MMRKILSLMNKANKASVINQNTNGNVGYPERLKSDAILCVVIAVAVTLLHWSGFFAKLQVLMNKMFIRVLRFSQILSIRFPHKEYRLLILNLQLFCQNCAYSFTTTSSKIWVSWLVFWKSHHSNNSCGACAQQLNTVRLALSFFYSKQKLRGISDNWLKKPKLKFDQIRKILAK